MTARCRWNLSVQPSVRTVTMALEIFVDRTATPTSVHLDDDTCDCDTGFELKSLKKDGQFTTQMQFIDKVVDVPVVMQRKVPTIQKRANIVEVFQVKFVDKVAMCQSSGRDRFPPDRGCRRLSRFTRSNSSTRRWASQAEASSGSSSCAKRCGYEFSD